MACYIDEDEVWKCPKHPSKRRRHGVCHACLRDRLVILCPDCANVRPCACVKNSSSSSPFSFPDGRSSSADQQVSKPIDSEPSFRRSRSLAIPLLRFPADSDRTKTPSFWSVLRRSKTKRSQPSTSTDESSVTVSVHAKDDDADVEISNNKIDDFARMMMRSRSVGVGTKKASRDDVRSAKWKPWTPMKVFFRKGTNNEGSPNFHRG